jgi:uncharacterized RDD family membrane protein YckC
MMHDSVREELQTKIGSGPINRNQSAAPATASSRSESPAQPNPKPARTITTELNRQKTSPTLVEFQTKSAMLPDWRLQLQNAVRHRKAADATRHGSSGGDPYQNQAQIVTSGANALKPDFVQEREPAPDKEHADPRVAAALNRIDKSRKTFLPEAAPSKSAQPKVPDARGYPFNVVSRNGSAAAPAREMKASVNLPPKPRLVPTITLKKGGYDTNKLPPLPAKESISSFDIPVPIPVNEPVEPSIKIDVAGTKTVECPTVFADVVESDENEVEEFDDLAPFALRFNAGLFDFIIGLFASLILLSPIAFSGSNWMSAAGLLALVGTCSVVMFVYLTLSIALFGRTAGMKLFSLELVDADLNEYPTFHQAAVSSAVYLLTLPLGGIGFLTMLLNDEKRAAHDLLSGTIIVTEF